MNSQVVVSLPVVTILTNILKILDKRRFVPYSYCRPHVDFVSLSRMGFQQPSSNVRLDVWWIVPAE